MLTTTLLHPEILGALGAAGHGSRVLIADGNFPASTTLGPNAALVSLNLSPGVVGAEAILAALLATIPVEAACVMAFATRGEHALAGEPPIWDRFRAQLAGAGCTRELDTLARASFYEAVRGPDVALVIASAETATYANLLLTLGVVTGS